MLVGVKWEWGNEKPTLCLCFTLCWYHQLTWWQAILHWQSHMKISYYLKKKNQCKKKSTAWWCIGLVQTAFECLQKNPHPRLDFMSGSSEVLNFGLNFWSSSQSLVWTLVLDWTSAFKSLLQSLVHVFASPVFHCFCKFNSSSVGFAGSSATGHLEPFQYILPVPNLWELPISFFSMAPNR